MIPRRGLAGEVPGGRCRGAKLDEPRPLLGILVFVNLTLDGLCLSFPRLKVDPKFSSSEYDGKKQGCP